MCCDTKEEKVKKDKTVKNKSEHKEYLNVRELASLFGLNVQTLHYYDKIGIFKPNYRDANNGYRKYRFDQIYKLASIRYMRKLGYSIESVQEFQDTRNPDDALQKLKERSAAIRAQWEELMRVDQAIMRKIQFIEESRDAIDFENFRLVEFPERKYLPIGAESELYMDESFYFYPTIVFYKGEKKMFGALLTDVSEEEPEGALTIPGGTYLVGYHKGAYEQIQKSFERMKKWGEDGQVQGKLDDTILALNIIDQFVEQQKDHYATRLEIRLLDEE